MEFSETLLQRFYLTRDIVGHISHVGTDAPYRVVVGSSKSITRVPILESCTEGPEVTEPGVPPNGPAIIHIGSFYISDNK